MPPKKKKGRGQKHQNKTKFKHNAFSAKSARIESMPITDVCGRCAQILQWRKDYRKYKPLTTMRRCEKCELRKIKLPYVSVCSDCVAELKICAKCKQPCDDLIMHDPDPENEDLVWQVLNTMREREKRTVMRAIKKGQVSFNDILRAQQQVDEDPEAEEPESATDSEPTETDAVADNGTAQTVLPEHEEAEVETTDDEAEVPTALES
ncbi:MAG: hypothetical protein MHM6MM_004822 [Cercozoa sp. M6MM]